MTAMGWPSVVCDAVTAMKFDMLSGRPIPADRRPALAPRTGSFATGQGRRMLWPVDDPVSKTESVRKELGSQTAAPWGSAWGQDSVELRRGTARDEASMVRVASGSSAWRRSR